MDRASLEQMLGQGLSLSEIGRRFDLHESTVGYWVGKHGLQAVRRDKHTAKGGLPREDLEHLTEAGASIAEIAEAVGRSKATVRYWLTRHGLRTINTAGRRVSESARAAKDAGQREATIALSLETLRAEAKKCVLLCSNCHAEIEDGTALLPDDVLHRYSPG